MATALAGHNLDTAGCFPVSSGEFSSALDPANRSLAPGTIGFACFSKGLLTEEECSGEDGNTPNVVADFPFSIPASAKMKAPVQTEK